MENEMLNYLVENGMINLLEMQEKMELTRREKILAKHAYSIWEGVDGLWHTYLPDGDKGRIPRKRKTREDMPIAITKEVGHGTDSKAMYIGKMIHWIK